MTVPTAAASPLLAPLPEANQEDAVGQRSRQDLASSIVQAHRSGLMARRERDLLSEKLLLHVDGSGDFQWADIFEGQRVVIPRMISEYRKTENVLRLVVDNAVAHHTSMPLRYFADAGPDRRSRDQALVDMLWMNFVADDQDLNGLFADALYMAMPAGFCPMHVYWRDEAHDRYETVWAQGGAGEDIVPGMIDCWVGNPFDTVFDIGARRGSVGWCSYGRVLSADLIRNAYGHIPGVDGLEGGRRIPSAAIFQRIAQSWKFADLGIHGTAVLGQRGPSGPGAGGEELLTVICREVIPDFSSDYPKGRLQLVAVPGEVDLRRGAGGSDKAILLVDQDLPAGDFSWSLWYSHHRGDDILGKPWVEDIDQLQVDLNIARSKRWEFLNRGIEAPIVAPGGAINDDMADLGGYNILEVEPSLASWRPHAMEWPAYLLQGLDKEIAEIRSAIYTGGGYQAVSRGEAPGSRMAYRAIIALQQADNSIHGPVNQRFRRSACDFARRCWKQMKTYGSVPWLMSIAGDQYAHLVDPYIDNTKLSDRAPNFKLVNAFGPSPELRAQEILNLMQTRGADGVPFLTTEQAQRLYPNPMMFGDETHPKAVQRRRARVVATRFITLTAKFRETSGMGETAITHPWVQQAAMQLFGAMEVQYPRLRDDDLVAHLNALSEITQDETADPITRLAAQRRQDLYYKWQSEMAGMPVAGPASAGALGPGKPDEMDPRTVAAEMRGARGGSGTVLGEEDTGSSPIAATARG